MSAESFARAIEQTFAGRPHVGAVTHFEGLDLPAVAARVRGALERLHLRYQDAVEDADGRRVYNALALVPAGGGMELWVAAGERQGVGCQIEVRLFHSLEESAQADEYLAELVSRLVDEPPPRPESPGREAHARHAS